MSTFIQEARIQWADDRPRFARWHSESGLPAPRRVVVADDRMSAATAYRLAREGTALLWRGDFHNGRQLLRALGRRVDDSKGLQAGVSPAETFRLHRRAWGQRALVLGKLLVLLEGEYSLDLRRAPDVRSACRDAYGPPSGQVAVSLRELMGVIGARQWREKGVDVPALGARIQPHYGVFSPVRGEYVELVARASLARPCRTAFDLGTGTGVLAAVLARRGCGRVFATDISARARECARENVRRLGLEGRVSVDAGGELYPSGTGTGTGTGVGVARAELVVCNPPWLPVRPTSELEQGVYDAGGAMLHGFLSGLPDRLAPGGEGWLVLSDLAEHLGLRTRSELLSAVDSAGLRVLGRLDTRPRHPRARGAGGRGDHDDPLRAARAAEVISLWRLGVV